MNALKTLEEVERERDEAIADLQWHICWGRAAPAARDCQYCGAVIQRKGRESPGLYRKRKYCNKTCAGSASSARWAAGRGGTSTADDARRLVRDAGFSRADAARVLRVSVSRINQILSTEGEA